MPPLGLVPWTFLMEQAHSTQNRLHQPALPSLTMINHTCARRLFLPRNSILASPLAALSFSLFSLCGGPTITLISQFFDKPAMSGRRIPKERTESSRIFQETRTCNSDDHTRTHAAAHAEKRRQMQLSVLAASLVRFCTS